jgi:hypothetical protein
MKTICLGMLPVHIAWKYLRMVNTINLGMPLCLPLHPQPLCKPSNFVFESIIRYSHKFKAYVSLLFHVILHLTHVSKTTINKVVVEITRKKKVVVEIQKEIIEI